MKVFVWTLALVWAVAVGFIVARDVRPTQVLTTDLFESAQRCCVVDTYDDGEQVWQCDDGCYFKGRVRPGQTPRLNCPEETIHEDH